MAAVWRDFFNVFESTINPSTGNLEKPGEKMGLATMTLRDLQNNHGMEVSGNNFTN